MSGCDASSLVTVRGPSVDGLDLSDGNTLVEMPAGLVGNT